jgi:diguanylate cyclase (GGDEF)-like protein
MIKSLPIDVIKVVVLLLASFLLSVIISNTTRIKSIHENFSSRQNESFVFQLVKEYANFRMVSRSDNIDYAELWLAYDITWSRFDVLINRSESSSFVRSANFKSFFASEFEKFKSIASAIKLVEEDELSKESLQKKIDICYDTLLNFSTEKLRKKSPVIEAKISAIERLVIMQHACSVFLVLVLIATVGIFYADFLTKKRLRCTDNITGFQNRAYLMEFVRKNARTDNIFDIYFVRIRNLREINQKYGLEYGDLALGSVAKCLRAKTSQSTIAFRSGGSQFLFFVPVALGSSEEIQEQFIDALSDYISVGSFELIVDAVVRHKRNIRSKYIMELLTTMQG